MKQHATIENSYNIWGHLGYAAAILFMAGCATLYFTSVVSTIGFAVFATLVLSMFIGRYLWFQLEFRKRSKTIRSMATEHKWVYDETNGDFAKGIDFSELSLNKLSEHHDLAYKNCLFADDWTYCDYSYGIYRKTKYGEYKAGETHYAVIATKLPRSLPNVLFDSVKSRKRQFKLQFAHSQLHKLEGDFDQHFATYFPEEYTIDGLSFITPDVMWVLRGASEYDIEIINDQLFIFGTMTNPEEQIPEMINHLQKIKKELLDNIRTYRDERLPYAEGRKRVALQGQVLRASMWPTIQILIGLGAAIAYWVIYSFIMKNK